MIIGSKAQTKDPYVKLLNLLKPTNIRKAAGGAGFG